MTSDVNPQYLCWLDLETTGLDPRPGEDVILEIAVIITTFEYPYIEQTRRHYLVKQRGDVRNMMDEYVLDMHARSGLLKELDEPDAGEPLGRVENLLLDLSQDWPPSADKDPEVMNAKRASEGVLPMNEPFTTREKLREDYQAARRRATDRRVVIAGNSVGFDLSFLNVHMPSFAARLSHRVFDVSAWSMGAQSMGMSRVKKKEAHRAMVDVESSIQQACEIAAWSMGMEPIGAEIARVKAEK